MAQYIGLGLGDITAVLSNYLKSRKKALFIFYCIVSIFLILFFTQHNSSQNIFILSVPD